MAGNRRKAGGNARPSSSGSRSQRRGAAQDSSRSSEAFEVSGSNRTFFLIGLFVLFALALVVRLVYLQVVAADECSQKAQDSRMVETQVEARRGTIYDRNGNVLACSVDATTIYAVPSEVTDPHGTAVVIGTLLKMNEEDVKRLEASLSDRSSNFCYVSRKERNDLADQVRNMGLDGIYFLEDSRREYPYGAVGGTVVGFVNVDGEGVSGLESQYDSILRGVDGVHRYERGVMDVPIAGSGYESIDPVDGQDIMISLDIEMQAALEEILTRWSKNLGCETEAVLMDGATGEIYAAGSTPLLDPTKTTEIKYGATELAIISRQYEPGSIFKTVTALTALEAKTVDVDDKFDCPAQLPADEYFVSDAHARGDVEYTFREIMQYSSNVGISLVAEKTGFDKLYNNIIAWGLDELTGVDYPGEAEGFLVDFDYWAKIQGYSVAFGQGISVTPIQMTRLYGAIANHGVACTPHFVIAYPQSGAQPTYETKKITQSEETLEKCTSMLQTVVLEGTGREAQMIGYDPAGKTGTAEIADGHGGYMTSHYNVSFVGYLPHTNRSFVCFTGAIEQPAEGNVSGMFSEIMTYAADRYKIVED